MNTSCVWYVGIGGEKLLFSCLAHNCCEGEKSRRVTFNPKSGGIKRFTPSIEGKTYPPKNSYSLSSFINAYVLSNNTFIIF